MADYKELLRRAITALPENNGAARRAVYEKARTALVGQLRAIQPPLPAREITQHRLQLEDCIRQVEQEASEAIIMLGRETAPPLRETVQVLARETPVPERAPYAPPAPPSVVPSAVETQPKVTPVTPAEPQHREEPEEKAPQTFAQSEPDEVEEETEESVSIEDIIGQAAEAAEVAVETVEDQSAEDPVSEPVVVEPADTAVALEPTPSETIPAVSLKAPSFTPRREPTATFAPSAGTAVSSAAFDPAPKIEPAISAPALPVEPALSSVREVELESDAREAEGVIERAIETLDREARGEQTEPLPDRTPLAAIAPEAVDDSGFAAVDAEPRSGSGLTIFLIVFIVLLVGAGGAGFWAWREGYVDLDQMFGSAQTTAQAQPSTEVSTTPSMDSMPTPDGAGDAPVGPGNTSTAATQEPTNALESLEVEDRLEPTPTPVVPSGNEAVLPSIGANGEAKTEERLSGQDTSIAAANDPAASVDPAVLAGSQSLLLEASTDGRGGAVPFSGTVDWKTGVDEIGLPTLIGEASIPARNLKVSVTIRKNSDPILPASHLMEVSFDVSDTFIGGSISTLAGVLLKNEELVPGTPLVGASARVVGNSFLFALSTSGDDITSNTELLETRRWLDLAVVYGTGRNAILTLEKDEEAQALFEQAFAAWAN